MSGFVRSKCVMPSSLRKRCYLLLCGGLVWASGSEVSGQTTEPQGGEYSLSGAIIGDQTNPQIAISPQGGYVVWQDNAVDGDNLGIAARRLNSSLSPSYGMFRVNKTGAGWQENPSVTLMRNGAAAI